jgi:alkaline phosphatase D
MEDPARSMLGRAQETWLSEGLRASRARWRLIAQSTQISPTSIATPLGRTTFNDAWDGYPQARLRLLQTIADLPERNVVTLGGDVHMNVAAPLRQRPGDPSSPVVASEFVTTSITSRGMSDNILSLIRASNPDLLHARSDERGYTLIDVRPDVLRAEFRSTPHPASASNPLRVQAAFQVLAGRPGPLPG